MARILIVGEGLDKYAGALSSSGRHVISRPPSRQVPKAGDAEMLLAHRDIEDGLFEVIKAARGIPKIVVTNGQRGKGLGRWLKEPLAYPLHDPSEREVLSFASRILKEGVSEVEPLRRANELLSREMAFFGDMNRALTSSTDAATVVDIVAKGIKDILQAKACTVLFLDRMSGDVQMRAEARTRRPPKQLLKRGEGIAGWVALSGQSLIVPDVRKDKRFSPKVDGYRKLAVTSLMCAPISIKGEVIGVVEVLNRKEGGPFDEEDMKNLLNLVDQAAFAMERISLHQKMEELVITDDLTNLFNSRYLNRSIDYEIQRSMRHSTAVSLIFMDLDHFKDINDNYGHLVGSKLLVELGQLLLRMLRNIDIVARYGGDEFVIVLPQTILNTATLIAERMRKAIELHTFLKAEGYNVKITSSFGVASFPESAKSKEELLRLADDAMYNIKNSTRNGVYAII